MLEQVMECCEMLKSHLTQQVCYAPRSVHPKKDRDSALVDRIRVCTQVHNTITKRLLSNPWQAAP